MWNSFHNVFSVEFRQDPRIGSRNKNYPRPLVKSITVLYLAKSNWSSIQLYRTFSSIQSDAKMFNYGKCSRRMLFLCSSIQINLRRVFKMSAFGIYACFETRECHWSTWAPAGFFPGGVKLLLWWKPAAGENFFKSCMLLYMSFSAFLGELKLILYQWFLSWHFSF